MTSRKHNKLNKKKLKRECWNLNYSFLRWLQIRLPIYLHDANKVIDLDYHKFEYAGIEYTQRELINLLLILVNDAVSIYPGDFNENYAETVMKIIDIWKLLFHAMWW